MWVKQNNLHCLEFFLGFAHKVKSEKIEESHVDTRQTRRVEVVTRDLTLIH